MFKFRFALKAIVVLVASMVFTSIAQAQMTQTFVSAQMGDDSNDCNLAKPCRTFNHAVNQVNAGGEVTALDSGDYLPFTISKSVTVQAAPGVYAGITSTVGPAVVITSGATGGVVVLRGLTLNGLGGNLGISSQHQVTLQVENCVINGFSNIGIIFLGGQLFVKDTVVRNSGSHGINLTSASFKITASIDHCQLEKNSLTGLFVAINGSETMKVTVRDTLSAGNGVGFNLLTSPSGTPAELNLENCVATNNGEGIHSERIGAIVRVSNSTITNNSIIGLLGTAGGSLISRGNNTVEGNGNANNGNFTGSFTAK